MEVTSATGEEGTPKRAARCHLLEGYSLFLESSRPLFILPRIITTWAKGPPCKIPEVGSRPRKARRYRRLAICLDPHQFPSETFPKTDCSLFSWATTRLKKGLRSDVYPRRSFRTCYLWLGKQKMSCRHSKISYSGKLFSYLKCPRKSRKTSFRNVIAEYDRGTLVEFSVPAIKLHILSAVLYHIGYFIYYVSFSRYCVQAFPGTLSGSTPDE